MESTFLPQHNLSLCIGLSPVFLYTAYTKEKITKITSRSNLDIGYIIYKCFKLKGQSSLADWIIRVRVVMRRTTAGGSD